MPFRRGAVLTTVASEFDQRWPDDLAELHEAGVTDLRVTLDWAQLQPRPTGLDDEWAERYEQLLAGAEAIDLRVWATLDDGSIPRWFDNDGGFDDDETFTTWWPRWVERIADRFGDSATGWVPFAEIPHGAPTQPWRDTWSILERTGPVVAAVAAQTTSVEEYVGRATHLGIALSTPWEHDETIGDRHLETVSTQWGHAIRDGADSFGGPVVITGFRPGHDDVDATAVIVEQLNTSLDDAIADGVHVEVCFLE